MNLLYLGSHSILEYDQVRMWTRMGIDVFSIGAYSDPRHPTDDKRPPIEYGTDHPEFRDLCHAQRVLHASEGVEYPIIDWAKYHLHHDLIDWADAIVVDCFPESWIGGPNLFRFGRKRVIWRTIGQSSPFTESVMGEIARKGGVEIVRYSPAEAAMPSYAGQDALIRFSKDPSDWSGWTGVLPVVGNVTQHMVDRASACGLDAWMRATAGLPTRMAGPDSERLRGVGTLSYEAMRQYLRDIRAYYYTGTVPASYTLGFIEALMTGVPMASVSASVFLPSLPDLFEVPDILAGQPNDLQGPLDSLEVAQERSAWGRARAIELFSEDAIAEQWATFLGVPVAVAA